MNLYCCANYLNVSTDLDFANVVIVALPFISVSSVPLW